MPVLYGPRHCGHSGLVACAAVTTAVHNVKQAIRQCIVGWYFVKNQGDNEECR